jgi:translation elongation factor EF-1alpha
MSLVLQNSYGKSHLIHFVDTPGHVNFVDEVASVIRLVDGIILVVDVVEGVGVSATNRWHFQLSFFIGDVQHRSYYTTCATRGCQNYPCSEQN